ncbi:MAG: hypothetical protein JKY70_05610 [Mucilaginibacter sp.]|nr:hypothetical protein [Mucilaginibacter sp.]
MIQLQHRPKITVQFAILAAMFDVFKAYVLGHASVSENELALLEAAAKVKKLRKRQYLLQEGDICLTIASSPKACCVPMRSTKKATSTLSALPWKIGGSVTGKAC